MSARRYRSTVACHSCRQRKVRCSINVTGVPCIRCAQDHAECVVDPLPAESARTSRRNASARHRLRAATSSPSVRGALTEGNVLRPPRTPAFQRPPSESPAPAPATSASERYSIQDEERNGLEIAEAALGNPEQAGQVPFYTGDKTGITSTLTLLAPEGTLPRHFLIPSRATTSLSEEDRNYLASKGVFNLPSSEACHCLLQAYFRHVHTIMPIIEADQILHFFHAGRLHEFNLLLVWSVFFVAVNFVPSSICEREGYNSRKAMKAAMYSHAKCLYNNSGERDKVVLLQSSLMLGFWHSEVDEHVQPWYWTGISVTLCQILGLHRNPDAARYNASITDRQRHLWRRLWWTCFFRDRWLSLTLGRPLRIDLDDCDVAMPLVGDLLYDLKHVPESLLSAFIPDEVSLLAEYWIQLIGMNPRVSRLRPLRPRSLVTNLQTRPPRIGMVPRDSTCITSNYITTILIVLYRPSITDPPDETSPNHQMQWQGIIRSKADSAASRTNEILETLAQENLLEYALPMTPPLLIPAMQIHLLNCRTGNPLSRRLRLNKLNVCMMVMEEFQKVYTVASIYRGIFAKAIREICPDRLDEHPDISVSLPAAAPLAARPDDIVNSMTAGNPGVSTDMDDMVDALLNESSALNFWETWGQLWIE
ncbi:putative Zn(II)2Cys6 transcription factor [Aspergillus uvarum CBS 121591]|uniref:Putative Zn(II)2Cys6 transcription factor n=1 Tax=Aspergillus uvarum CBS 121591 TaxID=1448315 RepID=A0A319CDK5_9EURO|nr:putative Zn(II)2Cys6 transcription factor [Aspergillus uvarum CBS 121591]PYH81781.1 putative Zn(II)2Cys6 transcription factor [Aspergillus uvarum CBS 121591]